MSVREGDCQAGVRLPNTIKDWMIAAVLFVIGYATMYGLMAIPQ